MGSLSVGTIASQTREPAPQLTPLTEESTGARLSNGLTGIARRWPGMPAHRSGSRPAATDPISPMTMAKPGNRSIVVTGMLSAFPGSSVLMVKLVSWGYFHPIQPQAQGDPGKLVRDPWQST